MLGETKKVLGLPEYQREVTYSVILRRPLGGARCPPASTFQSTLGGLGL